MIKPDEVVIRTATVEEIRLLRHRVLRAGLPLEAADFEHDLDPDTFHAAAEVSGQVIGCATIIRSSYEGQRAWRLRGMAVDPGFHRRGIGIKLLQLCEKHASVNGPHLFWCNARTPAVPFYSAAGWTESGTEFEIPTAGPHYRMTKFLLK